MKIRAIKSSKLNHMSRNELHRFTDQISAFLEKEGEWLEREQLETDPTYRQVIPYTMVSSQAMRKRVLMQRCKGQGEARLFDKYYIGAGGHVEEGHSIVYTALKECTEELGLPLARLQLTGIMITDGSMVDDVHVCIFGMAETHYEIFRSPEGPLHNARWASDAELLAHIPKMEKWSAVLVKHLIKA